MSTTTGNQSSNMGETETSENDKIFLGLNLFSLITIGIVLFLAIVLSLSAYAHSKNCCNFCGFCAIADDVEVQRVIIYCLQVMLIHFFKPLFCVCVFCFAKKTIVLSSIAAN